MPALVECCDIILGNEEDAEKVFGIKPEGFDASSTGGAIDQSRFKRVCEQLMKKFPRARKVIITLRGSINANHNTWGGVLWDGHTLYESRRYDITHIVDRVGGGAVMTVRPSTSLWRHLASSIPSSEISIR